MIPCSVPASVDPYFPASFLLLSFFSLHSNQWFSPVSHLVFCFYPSVFSCVWFLLHVMCVFLFSCLGYVLLNAFVLIIDVFDFWNLIHTFIIMFLWLLLHVYFSLEQHLTDEKSRRHKSSLHKIRAAPGVRRPWLHHEAWLRRWDEKKRWAPKTLWNDEKMKMKESTDRYVEKSFQAQVEIMDSCLKQYIFIIV